MLKKLKNYLFCDTEPTNQKILEGYILGIWTGIVFPILFFLFCLKAVSDKSNGETVVLFNKNFNAKAIEILLFFMNSMIDFAISFSIILLFAFTMIWLYKRSKNKKEDEVVES